MITEFEVSLRQTLLVRSMWDSVDDLWKGRGRLWNQYLNTKYYHFDYFILSQRFLNYLWTERSSFKGPGTCNDIQFVWANSRKVTESVVFVKYKQTNEGSNKYALLIENTVFVSIL